MGRRTYEVDIFAMALLYRKEYTKTDMILVEKAKKFDEVINYNLDKINSSQGIGLRSEERQNLYFYATGENNKSYIVINPSADLKRAWDYHVNCLSMEVLVASLMDNALKEIGLIRVDGKIIDRESYYNFLSEKYNMNRENKTKKFDVFRDYEKTNSFVYEYCISDKEKAILNELRNNLNENSKYEQEQIKTLKKVKI